MCTRDCVRPRDAGLSPVALDTLADLYAHPIVRLLADTFRAAGGQLFVVGGPVRDALRGNADFADLDFTTNLRPERTKRALRPLGTLWSAGERFGTIGVSVTAGGAKQKVEVTTFRTETYTEDSRKPYVGFGDHICDDLRRRDLTVNAIAMNVIDGCLVDPFGGIDALAAGVLDTPDDPVVTLSEDPLRILRAFRFAGKLDARLSPRLHEAVADTRDRLSIVAAERRLAEFDKLAEVGMSALVGGLRLAAELGVLAPWVPAPVTVDDLTEPESLTGGEELLAALLYRCSASEVDATLRAMKMPVERIRTVVRILSACTHVTAGRKDTVHARQLLRQFDDVTLASAARVRAVVTGEPDPFDDQVAELARDEPGVRDPLPVDGNDLLTLGLKGRAIGATLAHLEAEVCAAGSLDRDRALALATAAHG